jgi:hypothetical protein
VEVVTLLLSAEAQVDAQDRVWRVEIRVDLFFVSLDGLPSILLAKEVMWRLCLLGLQLKLRLM